MFLKRIDGQIESREAHPVTKGINGQFEITAGSMKVKISHKGFWAFLDHGHKGEKEFLISSPRLTIEYKRPCGLIPGFLRLSFRGGESRRDSFYDIRHDENTVLFNKKQEKEFERFRDVLSARLSSFEQSLVDDKPTFLQPPSRRQYRNVASEEKADSRPRRVSER